MAAAPRGRKRNAEAAELARLQRENEQLRQRLAQAEAIIEVQKALATAWAEHGAGERGPLMQRAVQDLVVRLGVAPACRALSVPRCQWYRTRAQSPEPATRQVQTLLANAAARALSAEECAAVLAVRKACPLS